MKAFNLTTREIDPDLPLFPWGGVNGTDISDLKADVSENRLVLLTTFGSVFTLRYWDLTTAARKSSEDRVITDLLTPLLSLGSNDATLFVNSSNYYFATGSATPRKAFAFTKTLEREEAKDISSISTLGIVTTIDGFGGNLWSFLGNGETRIRKFNIDRVESFEDRKSPISSFKSVFIPYYPGFGVLSTLHQKLLIPPTQGVRLLDVYLDALPT